MDNMNRQLSEAIPTVGKLVTVPELLTFFLVQPDRVNALRAKSNLRMTGERS